MYTKGPWVVSSTFLVCAKPSAAIVANCTPLVEIPELSIPLDEVADNARLIAAAPELYEALEPFATWRCEDPIRKEVVPTKYKSETLLYDCGKCKTCKARAAIAKATGK